MRFLKSSTTRREGRGAPLQGERDRPRDRRGPAERPRLGAQDAHVRPPPRHPRDVAVGDPDGASRVYAARLDSAVLFYFFFQGDPYRFENSIRAVQGKF